MTYFLIAIAVLVCWYVAGLAIFTRIDREVGDGDTPETQRERNFAKIGAGLVMIFAMWAMMDPLNALAWRIDNIRPLVAECRAGNGETCHKLANTYRQGLSGNCAWDGSARLRHRECELVARNDAKAEMFTRLACTAGRSDSCLVAIAPARGDAQLQSARQRCGQGDLAGCDDYLARYPLTPLSDLLPEAEIRSRCDAGNLSICLRSAFDELRAALPAPNDPAAPARNGPFLIAAQGLGTYVAASPGQLLAAMDLLELSRNITFAQDYIRPGNSTAMQLRAELAAIAIPPLAEGAAP